MDQFRRTLSSIRNAPNMRRIHPALNFFFVWTFLPSLAFFPIWITGGPIRTPAIVLYLLVGLLAIRLPMFWTAVLFIIVVLLDVVRLISVIFNLAPISALYAIKYIATLQPFASSTYLLFSVAIITTSVAVIWFARRLSPQWRSVSLSGACFGALFMMSADMAANLTPEYSWGRLFRATAPFDSAMQNSGLAQQDLASTRRDLFIVMIESWGELANPSYGQLIRSPLRRGDISERYTIKSGNSDYFGSTTAGELRELCGRWAEFGDYTDSPASVCLPAHLGEAGYETVAFHGFTGRMFDRHLWYPNLGFRDIFFSEHLWNEGLRVCNGVFVGICDVDLARLVERALVDGNDSPRFVYWLTLNSHLPVDPTIDIKFLDCNGPKDPFAQKQVCYLADQWMQVLDKVAGILANEDLRPLDVLIVGDHAPPFWTREGKSFFVRGKVPWILLQSRPEVS